LNGVENHTVMPTPVWEELLMQVWPEAQKMPLPQSRAAGAIVGRALALHSSKARAHANSVKL
jgi:hypothetical protein